MEYNVSSNLTLNTILVQILHVQLDKYSTLFKIVPNY